MKVTQVILFLAAMAPGAAWCGLDLTYHQTVIRSEAGPLPRYYFQDGATKLSFRVDPKTTLSGGGDAVGFHFSDLVNADMKIYASPLAANVPFAGAELEKYRAAMTSLLPRGAQEVKVEQEMADPIAINGWKSYQFIVTYKFYTEHYRRSIIFLDYSDTQQFVVDVSAKPEDYAKAYRRGFLILNSISEMREAEVVPTSS